MLTKLYYLSTVISKKDFVHLKTYKRSRNKSTASGVARISQRGWE